MAPFVPSNERASQRRTHGHHVLRYKHGYCVTFILVFTTPRSPMPQLHNSLWFRSHTVHTQDIPQLSRQIAQSFNHHAPVWFSYPFLSPVAYQLNPDLTRVLCLSFGGSSCQAAANAFLANSKAKSKKAKGKSKAKAAKKEKHS